MAAAIRLSACGRFDLAIWISLIGSDADPVYQIFIGGWPRDWHGALLRYWWSDKVRSLSLETRSSFRYQYSLDKCPAARVPRQCDGKKAFAAHQRMRHRSGSLLWKFDFCPTGLAPKLIGAKQGLAKSLFNVPSQPYKIFQKSNPFPRVP